MYNIFSVAIQSELQQIFSQLQELNQNGPKVYDEARNKAVAMGMVVQEKVQTSMEYTMQRVTSKVSLSVYVCLSVCLSTSGYLS